MIFLPWIHILVSVALTNIPRTCSTDSSVGQRSSGSKLRQTRDSGKSGDCWTEVKGYESFRKYNYINCICIYTHAHLCLCMYSIYMHSFMCVCDMSVNGCTCMRAYLCARERERFNMLFLFKYAPKYQSFRWRNVPGCDGRIYNRCTWMLSGHPLRYPPGSHSVAIALGHSATLCQLHTRTLTHSLTHPIN